MVWPSLARLQSFLLISSLFYVLLIVVVFVFIVSRLRASSILFTTTLGLFGSLTSCLGKRGRRQNRRGSQPKSPCTQPHLTWTAWALPSSPPPPPSPPLIGSHSPQHLGQLQNIKLFSQVEIMSRVVSDYLSLYRWLWLPWAWHAFRSLQSVCNNCVDNHSIWMFSHLYTCPLQCIVQ